MIAVFHSPIRVALATIAIWFVALESPPAMAGDAMAPIDFRRVQVGGEIGRRIDITINKNLLKLDTEREFLAPFRAKTGPKGDLGEYIGIGQLIEASVRFAAYAKDEKLIAWKKRLVEETIQAQEPDGYFGMMAGADRVTRLWDASESGYLILGLLTDYQYLGEKRSLEAARKLADYLVRRWSGPPAKWPKVSLINSSIGLEYAMLLLYRETGDRRYLDFCVQKRSLQDWAAGLAVGPRSPIREHAYGYVGNCLAQLELHRVQPSDRLLQPTRQAIAFLTAQDYATITGEAGRDEHLIDDQDVRGPVGETCATVYLIRFYDHLLQMTGDSRFGDLMERTIYNALFAAQSPDGRRLRYFVPLEGPREYFRVNRYCCPNNYRRGVSELPTLICYRSGAGAAVNLYAPSEAAIDLSGGVSLKVRQETDYPTSGRVVIRLDPSKPAKFLLQLRIPRWCRKASVAVNGQPWDRPVASAAFLTLDREWKAGDQVTLDMPMTWRLVLGSKMQAGYAAVMCGPMVYCLNPTRNAAIKSMRAGDLKEIKIDPASLKELPGDNAVRPGGMACQVRAECKKSAAVRGRAVPEADRVPRPGRHVHLLPPDRPNGRETGRTFFQLRQPIWQRFERPDSLTDVRRAYRRTPAGRAGRSNCPTGGRRGNRLK